MGVVLHPHLPRPNRRPEKPGQKSDVLAITLKITAASEINAVTPSTVLVLPENSTGNFDVIIESSGDLVTWNPIYSQTVNSETAENFFRVRIVKTAALVPPKE